MKRSLRQQNAQQQQQRVAPDVVTSLAVGVSTWGSAHSTSRIATVYFSHRFAITSRAILIVRRPRVARKTCLLAGARCGEVGAIG